MRTISDGLRRRAEKSGGSEIRVGLWIGDVYFAESTDLLRELGIRHVLTVLKVKTHVLRHVCERNFLQGKTSIGGSGLEQSQIEEDDLPTSDLLSHFERSCDLIQRVLDEGNGILVHCQAQSYRHHLPVAYQ